MTGMPPGRGSTATTTRLDLPDARRLLGADDLVQVLERIVIGGVAITARALGEGAPGMDLTFPQWRVLLVVGETDQGATISTVARRVGVTVPATSRQLRRLADRGLITIAPDITDRRSVRVQLTHEGRRVRTTILGYRLQRIGEIAGRSRASADVLRALNGIAEAFDEHR